MYEKNTVLFTLLYGFCFQVLSIAAIQFKPFHFIYFRRKKSHLLRKPPLHTHTTIFSTKDSHSNKWISSKEKFLFSTNPLKYTVRLFYITILNTRIYIFLSSIPLHVHFVDKLNKTVANVNMIGVQVNC